jgi:hypothetical protein
MAVIDVQYDNPLLNHPEIMNEILQNSGPEILDFLIDWAGRCEATEALGESMGAS